MAAVLQSGTLLGRYQLLVEIGRGGMASVWVARVLSDDASEERLVAVKAMLPELARNRRFRAMFLDEGQIVQSIDHPNVVRVYDVGESGGILYMAMEWVVGDSLRAVITAAQARRAIPVDIAARVISDAAAGLHAAHELRSADGELRNLVHCDVSPHNLLVGLDGAIKLVDFGVASAVGRLQDLQSNQVRGKIGYMSPEQARGDVLDRRSDVFSLAVVLFELTTGERLFRAKTREETLRLVVEGVIPAPCDIVADYPKELQRILLRGLARDISARFQSADELRSALDRYLVSQRIVVPRAGVSGLLRRVLRERLEHRRAAVRAALKRVDGMDPARQSSARILLEDADSTTTTSGIDGMSLSGGAISQVTWTGSSHPGAAHIPGDAPSLPRATTRPKRSRVLPVALAAMCACLALVAAYLWRSNPADDDAVTVMKSLSSTPASATAIATEPATASDDAVSLDSLPSAADAGKQPSATRGRAPAASEPQGLTLEEETPGPVNAARLRTAVAGAAASAGGCKAKTGPTGPGRATVTFSPSGRVSAASVSAPYAGTPVGACIAHRFRALTIPAFTGSPVTVRRSFNVR